MNGNVKRARAARRKIICLMPVGEVITARALCSKTGMSLRNLYRSIAILRKEGQRIAGQAGVGYMRRR